MDLKNYEYSGSTNAQNVEYQTISSELSGDKMEQPERLYEWLTSENIEYLHERFKEKKKMSYTTLRQELQYLNIKFTDLEYNRLFLKINQNHDFQVDWNEFISYLIYGFQEDDPDMQKEALVLPISFPPVIKKSGHRSTICSIALLRISEHDDLTGVGDKGKEENVTEDDEELARRTMECEESPDLTGLWITASREGQIRFWSMNFECIRNAKSESIHSKMTTWILAIVALSDVNIVGTSSTEREIRFHETVASTFSLRMVIRSLPYAVCYMSYTFHPNANVNSRIVLGDYGGNVRILQFNPYLRGPFQSKPGAALIDVFWSDILKDKFPHFKCREYISIHSEMIQQTFYSIRLNALFCAAEYRNVKKYRGRCPGLIVCTGADKTIFRIPLGVTTFFVDEKNNVVITGGPDTLVRIWDVYVSSEPSGILSGHNSGIVKVFVQSEEKKAYSIDYQKIIKVWDISEHTLLQTYGDLVRLMHAECDLVYYYNRDLRELVVGGRKLIALKCNPRVRVDITDGCTHSAPVSVVLYNRLFRNIVTVGLDSYIIVWEPYTGKRKVIIKHCHTKQMYDENIDIEITAACFDPLEQFLLTGARDGSLKIWNYNDSMCIRNMCIKNEHQVTAVIWVKERILAVGWDQQVTEFNDVEGREYGDPKRWPMFHTDDITCADVKLGEGVVTATYSGELIFWKLETGQPYRRYSVANPTKFIELKYNKNDNGEDDISVDIVNDNELEDSYYNIHFNDSRNLRKSVLNQIIDIEKALSITREARFTGPTILEANTYEDKYLKKRKEVTFNRKMSVQAVLFLQTRPMSKDHGSVFVALETGVIQIYSHHQRGGYLKEFNAVQKTGDCVLAMTTDRKNRYLFTGSAFGYVKIWHIQNFCVPEWEKQKICMPSLRLKFIFLHKETFIPRAKRAVRNQKEPLLLSSYKAHLKAINSIVFINLPKILITGSHDFSVRLWSLGGRYLGTLGTTLPWMKLSPFEPAEKENKQYRMPPDIKKVASSTTMKVVSGIGQHSSFRRVPQQRDSNVTEKEDATHMYGKQLREPILGNHFQLPGRCGIEQHVELNTTYSHTPVYAHLKIHQAELLERPPTPPTIRRVANESFMDFYEPTQLPNESVKSESLWAYMLKTNQRSLVKKKDSFVQ